MSEVLLPEVVKLSELMNKFEVWTAEDISEALAPLSNEEFVYDRPVTEFVDLLIIRKAVNRENVDKLLKVLTVSHGTVKALCTEQHMFDVIVFKKGAKLLESGHADAFEASSAGGITCRMIFTAFMLKQWEFLEKVTPAMVKDRGKDAHVKRILGYVTALKKPEYLESATWEKYVAKAKELIVGTEGVAGVEGAAALSVPEPAFSEETESRPPPKSPFDVFKEHEEEIGHPFIIPLEREKGDTESEDKTDE